MSNHFAAFARGSQVGNTLGEVMHQQADISELLSFEGISKFVHTMSPQSLALFITMALDRLIPLFIDLLLEPFKASPTIEREIEGAQLSSVQDIVVMLERDEETWHVDIEPIPAAAGKPPGARIKVRGIKALVDNQPWKVKKSMMSFSGKLNLRVTVTRLVSTLTSRGCEKCLPLSSATPTSPSSNRWPPMSSSRS